MDIPLNVDVHCTDGRYGRSTYIILNPAIDKLTHVVVKTQKAPHTERVVPIKWVKETTPELILLNRTKEQVATADLFKQTDFDQRDVPHYATDPRLTLLWPYRVPAKKIISDEYQKIPPGELAVSRGARVRATDGRIGQVDEFLIDPESEYITHLVLREGLPWDKKHIAIPVSDIDRIVENTVHLKIDKQNVK
ncbi:MAG: PRC-barrel domain-containing protein, partial [Anaerolineae bacterium]|nr:PRC-barrel domain-containing protein [Anaerolineae bacterium]